MKFKWFVPFLLVTSAYAQRGGAVTQRTQVYLPDCVATSGSCPANGYACISSTVLYRCTIAGGWAATTATASDVTCTDCLNATEIEDIYLLNSGDVGTGVFDFGGATSLEVPNGTTPTVDTTGEVGVDTTEDNLLYMGSASLRTLSYINFFSFTLETPADADNFLVFKAPYDITVTDIDCIVDPADSSESVVIDVQERNTTGDSPATLDATITCDNDGAADDGSLSNPTITTGEWVSIDIGTVTGTVTQIVVTVAYTVTRK